MIFPNNKEIAEIVKEFTEYHTALIMSLIEILIFKNLLDDEDLQNLKRKQTSWISKLDQLQAAKQDKALNSKSDLGTKVRLRMAMAAILNGDLTNFRKWIDKEKEINNISDPK